jgi:F0F1-type ATP synthase assembly protein I
MKSTWALLVALLLGIGAAVAILPACGDDSGSSDSDSIRPT